ncbi:hypothetical protein Tco_1405973 [Tanacetum coccineum]
MGPGYLKDSGFELTAFQTLIMPDAIDTRKSNSDGYKFLGDKIVSWMSKKQNSLQCFSRGEYVRVNLQVVSSNGDKDTALLRLWIQLT